MLIQSLYLNIRCLVHIAGSKSDLFPVWVGFCHSCLLSRVLLITFMDMDSVEFGDEKILTLICCWWCDPLSFNYDLWGSQLSVKLLERGSAPPNLRPWFSVMDCPIQVEGEDFLKWMRGWEINKRIGEVSPVGVKIEQSWMGKAFNLPINPDSNPHLSVLSFR